MFLCEFNGASGDRQQHSTAFKVRKDTGLPTKAVDYVHEPVAVHYVLDLFQQFAIPNVLVVRLVVDTVNHCDG